MKRFTAILLIMICVLTAAFAENLGKYLPGLSTEQQSQLLNGEMLTVTSGADRKVQAICPSSSFSDAIANKADNRKTGFAVATLKYIPFTESLAQQSKKDRQLFLFNTLRSISTQKGITYISHLAGEKETVLIEDTYLIGNKKDKYSRIEDPVSKEVLKTYSCYSYQKDNRFGSNIYKLDYKTNENEVFLEITNDSKMKYMGITCLKPAELKMYMDVIQTEEGFLLYSLAESANREPTITVLSISVDLPSAFSRRITSLSNWFEKKVSST